VSVNVINFLEAVEIEQEDRVARARAGWRRDCDIKRLLIPPAVGEAGESILVRQFAGMLFSNDACFDFPLGNRVLP
jgi:hypothetical protein